MLGDDDIVHFEKEPACMSGSRLRGQKGNVEERGEDGSVGKVANNWL